MAAIVDFLQRALVIPRASGSCFLIDVVKGSNNGTVASFHCFYTPLMSQPAGI